MAVGIGLGEFVALLVVAVAGIGNLGAVDGHLGGDVFEAAGAVVAIACGDAVLVDLLESCAHGVVALFERGTIGVFGADALVECVEDIGGGVVEGIGLGLQLTVGVVGEVVTLCGGGVQGVDDGLAAPCPVVGVFGEVALFVPLVLYPALLCVAGLGSGGGIYVGGFPPAAGIVMSGGGWFFRCGR